MPMLHRPVRLEHFGMCDASAAVPVGPTTFIVANDEDNLLRVYHADISGPAIETFDLEPCLIPDPKKKEADIEGGTWLDDKIYWITSHARNKKGKVDPNRYQFFAVKIGVLQDKISLDCVGKPYTRLLDDMLNDPALAKYGLKEASKLPPKEKGAFNIEGLCTTPEKSLYIGLRNPIPDDKALIIPLENPAELIEGNGPAKFGTAFQLDLGGLGIRSIKYWAARRMYVIVAGSFNGDELSSEESQPSLLYSWSGDLAQAPMKIEVEVADMNPEAQVIYPDQESMFQILSDDGNREVDGEICKDLSDQEKKRFRSEWITLPL
jgi:hypothetical protein